MKVFGTLLVKFATYLLGHPDEVIGVVNAIKTAKEKK